MFHPPCAVRGAVRGRVVGVTTLARCPALSGLCVRGRCGVSPRAVLAEARWPWASLSRPSGAGELEGRAQKGLRMRASRRLVWGWGQVKAVKSRRSSQGGQDIEAQLTAARSFGRRSAILTRSCSPPSRWRRVTVSWSSGPFSPRVSKSMVMPKGVPTSSWRA
jgi:hypothetical protein